jgi:hypothetical protein
MRGDFGAGTRVTATLWMYFYNAAGMELMHTRKSTSREVNLSVPLEAMTDAL